MDMAKHVLPHDSIWQSAASVWLIILGTAVLAAAVIGALVT